MLKAPTLRITNANTVTTCFIQHKAQNFTVELIGKPIWEQVTVIDNHTGFTKNLTNVYFHYELYRDDFVGSPDEKKVWVEDLLKRMNFAIKDAPYFFAMTIFMDVSKFNAVHDFNEQVIRLVGDNYDDECPEWK